MTARDFMRVAGYPIWGFRMVNRRELLELGAGAMVGAGFVGNVTAQENGQDGQSMLFFAGLRGGAEVPEVDTDAGGISILGVGDDGVDYSLGVSDIQNVIMAHIHRGGDDENGPVVAWLYPSADAREPELMEGVANGIIAQGTITADNLVGPLEGESIDALVDLLRSDEAYVNVHTQQNQEGEIRGRVRSAQSLLDVLGTL